MKKIEKTIITTPIYYPNDKLHIGHAYTTSLADILARFRKLQNKKVFFVTGSDEHGQKLFDKAKENNKDVFEYVSEIVKTFKDLWEKLDINYDLFIRTTDSIHQENVQKIFNKLKDNDLIYKGFYKGFYCKSDESYFTKSQLIDNKCPLCKREVSLFEEESYFLKIKIFKDWIKNTLQKDNILFPKERINELINSFIDLDLEDLSISRTNFNWGIKVPNDDKHVIYVWFDALLNYLSSLEYGIKDFDNSEIWNKEDTEIVQFLGKEIIRFHAIYWPIILHNLNYKNPKLLAHGWLVINGEKMSKSLGNVVDPLNVLNNWGSDSLRFYLINNISFGSDGKFSEELLKNSYNGILVNKFSNLINRTFNMNNKFFDGIIPKGTIKMNETKNLDIELNKLSNEIFEKMNNYDFNNYSINLIKYLDELNLYIDTTEPWKETNEDKLKEIIWYLINRIYSISLLFSPILTKSTELLFDLLKIDKHSFDNLFLNLNNIKLPGSLILFERKK